VFGALFSSTSDKGQPLYNDKQLVPKVSSLLRFHCICISDQYKCWYEWCNTPNHK